jgi:predicted phage terminase large subunit-like protein
VTKPLGKQDQQYLLALRRKRAILDAHDDLLNFARLMKPDPNHPADPSYSQYIVAKHHRAIAAAMEQVEAGKIRRLIITVPPRHGKSELASRLFPAWYVGRNPGDSIILASYADKLAWDFGREVKAYIEDPVYHQIFPAVELNTASVDRIETMAGGKLFFVGRGAATTGRGATGLLVDDPVKDRVEADSLTTRDKIYNWFQQVARTRLLSSVGWIVIILTRWQEDDLVGRLTDPYNAFYSAVEGPKWQILDLPALARENDPLGRKEGEALWPARFPVEYLEELRASDPRGFQALYQGSPTPEKGNFFDADKLRTYNRGERPPNDQLRFYSASDHAVSLKQERDKTCLLSIGIDADSNIWVMDDVIWGRFPTDRVVELMIDMMARYRPLYWWAGRDHITKSIGPFLRKRMLERSTFVAVNEIIPIADKKTRAQSIMARMAMGKVYFPAYAPWWQEAKREILQFPFGAHDDFVDTIACIGIGLQLQVKHHSPGPKPQGPKVGTLGWLKSESKRQADERKVRNGGW